jgi:hypothetical protein
LAERSRHLSLDGTASYPKHIHFADIVARMFNEDGQLADGVYKKIRDVIQQPHKHKHRKLNKKQGGETDSKSSVRGDSVHQGTTGEAESGNDSRITH